MFSQESVCPSFCSGGSPCDHYPWCIRPHCISPPSRHGDTPSTTLPLPNIVWPSLGTCSNRFIGPHCTALGYGNPLGRVRVIQIGFFKWYLPHTYDVGEGNVFRGVCLSTEGGSLSLVPCSFWEGGLSHRDPPGQRPLPLDRGPPHGKERAVRILLECVLVND